MIQIKGLKKNGSSNKIKQEETITLLDGEGVEYHVNVRVETKTKDDDSQIKIKVRDVEINSGVDFEKDGNSLKAVLSNGNKAEVKIMPDSASARAIEKLETKGLSIQLKEVGEGNDLSVVYEAKGNKTVKFLGLFKVRAEVEAVISAENGEILRLEKPWWYFLAFKEGVVDCDENNLDLCDDAQECIESGLIPFNDSCVVSCPEDGFVCEDNETSIFRSSALNCEFDLSYCPIIDIVTNETSTNQTTVDEIDELL